MEFPEVLLLLVIGLLAGTLGGLLGIGGSIVMIPSLTIVLGPNQHLYQAAAMIVNVFVAVPATLRHRRSGAIRWPVVWRMLPFGILFILVGVGASDRIPHDALKRIFGVFLVYVVAINVVKLVRRDGEPPHGAHRTGWAPTGFVGSVMGFAAGLLGIGGGGIAVPLLQRVCHLPLRQCIGCSAAVMCLTSIVGAVRKNAVLETLSGPGGTPLALSDSLRIAACLAPTALVGGMAGAWLTNALPLRWIRMAFILLLLWAAGRMLGVL
jgi:uncharacterized membrane protein YfcA